MEAQDPPSSMFPNYMALPRSYFFFKHPHDLQFFEKPITPENQYFTTYGQNIPMVRTSFEMQNGSFLTTSFVCSSNLPGYFYFSDDLMDLMGDDGRIVEIPLEEIPSNSRLWNYPYYKTLTSIGNSTFVPVQPISHTQGYPERWPRRNCSEEQDPEECLIRKYSSKGPNFIGLGLLREFGFHLHSDFSFSFDAFPPFFGFSPNNEEKEFYEEIKKKGINLKVTQMVKRNLADEELQQEWRLSEYERRLYEEDCSHNGKIETPEDLVIRRLEGDVRGKEWKIMEKEKELEEYRSEVAYYKKELEKVIKEKHRKGIEKTEAEIEKKKEKEKEKEKNGNGE